MKIRRQITVFDAADLAAESSFWAALLGGMVDAEDDWHSVVVDGVWRLGVQLAPDHVPPDWPDGTPQQQLHLDLWVDDLEAAHEQAISLGARLLQPADDPEADEVFQVYADPAGHPFCLCWAAADTGRVTVETLQQLVAAFNAHDLDAVMRFFTDDCVLELPRGPHPWGRRFEGREEVRSGLASRFAGIPDVHYGDDRHWVSGNRGCSEWLLTGTTTQGEPIEARGCDLFEFRGDKIARKDSYWKLVER